MNELLIKIFEKLIKINEYLNKTSNDSNFIRQNEFRIRSLKTGLKAIKNFLSTITSSSQLSNLPGIGKGIKDRIDEIINTKKLVELDQLCSTVDCNQLDKKNLKDEPGFQDKIKIDYYIWKKTLVG